MYMKVNYVDMKGTFSIKDSSERRKSADSPHWCGKFLFYKVSGLILIGKDSMPNKEFYNLILIWFILLSVSASIFCYLLFLLYPHQNL
ncbi:hypothetical protein HanPI659440_Chr00c15g0727851 [Helianthus annuus]|nr:hypothetical protein HanPI659440_Chr00c15g0727851 [Helianthus annuus]